VSGPALRVVERIADCRALLAGHRRKGETVGFVPTMGALHAGHVRLLEEARRGSDVLVVSIFVNRIQFNQPEDFERYPRSLDEDNAVCAAAGVDIVFAPPHEEMYPRPPRAFVDVERVTGRLCGRFRPGHFRGVATVVSKLFHIVQPDRAWFGEKDAQQLAVIRTMVRDLAIPVEIVGVPTVREGDGLALSSRNRRLSPHERSVAPALYRALRAGAEAARRRGVPAADVLAGIREELDRYPEIRVEYVEVVDSDEMQPVETVAAPALIAAAIWLGETRLIDNVLVE
jgi:pantoate--beta-alanine ligase